MYLALSVLIIADFDMLGGKSVVMGLPCIITMETGLAHTASHQHCDLPEGYEDNAATDLRPKGVSSDKYGGWWWVVAVAAVVAVAVAVAAVAAAVAVVAVAVAVAVAVVAVAAVAAAVAVAAVAVDAVAVAVVVVCVLLLNGYNIRKE